MHESSRRLRWPLRALVAAAAAQVVLPLNETVRAWSYVVIAIAAVTLAAAGVVTNRPRHRLGWVLVVAGFAGWALADLVWTVEQYRFALESYPVPSDAVYLASYPLVVAGIIVMIRTQRTSTRHGGLLDATIIATGASIFVASILILPLADDPTLSQFGKVVSSAYPMVDVALLVTAAQLWTTPGIKSRSYALLLLSMLSNFAPDLAWSISKWNVPDTLTNAGWLTCYVLLAAAACDPSMRLLGQTNRASETAATSRRRLALLAIGLLMPAGALFAQDAASTSGGLPLIGIGAFVLSVLTLIRMGSLLGVIQAQAVQLAALANCDSLTGAPNRRTWDHELSAACRTSQSNGTALSIALMDLDQFKKFNDRHGHQAGDLLLREAVAAWTEVIGDRGILARYGGEEFAVLLPHIDVDDAVNLMYALRAVTPSDQTFSAGVTLWAPGTEPSLALAQADRGLYNAKRAGRDRIVAFPATEVVASPTIPTPAIVFQPIVDLITGEVIAHEALSRFGERSPEAVFHLAAASGYGDILEGLAIVAAMEVPGRPNTALHVNASSAAMRSERFWDTIPEDLTGIVVEISEQYDGGGLALLRDSVARLRARGARIAADDLGSGSHELLRLAALSPDVVKLDRSLVSGCAGDLARQAVIRGGLEFTRSLGSELCAEGAQRLEDLETLRAIGVRSAQCFLLGMPNDTWSPRFLPLPFLVDEPASRHRA